MRDRPPSCQVGRVVHVILDPDRDLGNVGVALKASAVDRAAARINVQVLAKSHFVQLLASNFRTPIDVAFL